MSVSLLVFLQKVFDQQRLAHCVRKAFVELEPHLLLCALGPSGTLRLGVCKSGRRNPQGRARACELGHCPCVSQVGVHARRGGPPAELPTRGPTCGLRQLDGHLHGHNETAEKVLGRLGTPPQTHTHSVPDRARRALGSAASLPAEGVDTRRGGRGGGGDANLDFSGLASLERRRNRRQDVELVGPWGQRGGRRLGGGRRGRTSVRAQTRLPPPPAPRRGQGADRTSGRQPYTAGASDDDAGAYASAAADAVAPPTGPLGAGCSCRIRATSICRRPHVAGGRGSTPAQPRA